MLKQGGARWSKRRKSWYYIGWELPATLQRLLAEFGARDEDQGPAEQDQETLPTEDHDELEPSPPADQVAERTQAKQQESTTRDRLPETEAASEPEGPPGVRIIKPPAMPVDGETPDFIQVAIQQARSTVKVSAIPVPIVPPANGRGKPALITQTYVGELTGSVSGYVHCYGAATHQGQLIYLNMGGPRSSVEAIRAKISKGQAVNLVPPDAPAIELDPGEEAGMFADFTTRIPEAKFQHTILARRMGIEPNYGGKATTFIIRAGEAQGKARLKQHVFGLVALPVFDAWGDYLWAAGRQARLLRQPKVLGGLDLWMVDLDADAWTRLITGGVEQGVIAIPPPS